MKANAFAELTIEDLNDKLVELKKQYADLKARHFISPLENPLQIRTVRKDIARVNTEINKKNS